MAELGVMAEQARPTRTFLAEIGFVIADTNQFGPRHRLFHCFECAKEVLVALAQRDGADTDEAGSVEGRVSRDRSLVRVKKCRIDAVRIEETFCRRNAI